MQIKENNNGLDPESNFALFKNFLELLKEKLAGNLKANQTNLSLKMKIPVYKDPRQVLSLYENTFLKSTSSNSKKKSGTILIIWTLLKFAEIQGMTVDNFVNPYENLSTLIFLRSFLGIFFMS